MSVGGILRTISEIVISPVFLILAYFIAIVFLTSGLDDLFYDIYFWGRALRRAVIGRRYPPLTLEKMEAKEQQKVAILIPAWQEKGVIYRMLQAASHIQYRNHDIFVGTYPNDPETEAEVKRAAAEFPRVHHVVAPTPGLTTKADNLNNIYAGMVAHEHATGQRYEIIVTHDAEDLIHPYSLLLYNYLIPRKDMVQLPVFPAPARWWYFTYWSYADEFAEYHTKDLLVREVTGGFVPSAGVGAAFARKAFDLLQERSGSPIFNREILTEDYELGLRLRLEQLVGVFVLQRLPRAPRDGRPSLSGRWIATVALFPRSWQRAVRQKTRWVLGIALQSWAAVGWPPGLGIRYNLVRDRKVLLTHPTAILGYVLFAYFLLYEAMRRFYDQLLPVLVEYGTPLWYLVIIATALMVQRLLERLVAVWRIYGLVPALLSVPRAVWANFINGAAVMRAIWQYMWARLRGAETPWEKTAHEFPSEPALALASLARMARPFEYPAGRPPLARLAVRPATRDEYLESLCRRLQAPDESTRLRAIRETTRDMAGDILDALLPMADRETEPSSMVRAEACRTLGFLGLPRAVPFLVGATTDPAWPVRANAVRALAKLGPDGERALRGVLASPDRYARDAALWAFEQLGLLHRYVERLASTDPSEVAQAKEFFRDLERTVPSRLARELLRRRGYRGLLERPNGGAADH